jgi:hypothetical protein
LTICVSRLTAYRVTDFATAALSGRVVHLLRFLLETDVHTWLCEFTLMSGEALAEILGAATECLTIPLFIAFDLCARALP